MNRLQVLTTFGLLISLGGSFALAASADKEPTYDLEDWVVTGEKLGRTLQETQTSVSFYTGTALERTQAVSLEDVFKLTANTYAYDGGFSIRGITNTGFTNSEGSELASVLLDGARVDAQMLSFDGMALWDVEQVEILRGPQSTSQGRNSLAGAVVITSAQPTFDWTAKVRASYAELDTYQLAAAVSGPVVEDWLAFRVSVDRRYSDGSLTNVTRQEDDWERDDTLTVRGKLLFAPTSWNGLTVRLMAQQTDSDNGERAYAYADDWQGLFDRVAYEDVRNDFSSRSRLASLIVEQPLWEGWQFTSTTAWSDFWSDSAYDGDRTPSGAGQDSLVYGYGYDNDSLSQELRLLGRGENWRITGGLYVARDEQASTSTGPFYYTLPSAYPPLFGLPNPSRVLLDNNVHYAIQTTNQAAFIHGDWDVLEKLTLTVGGRFDMEKKERTSIQDITLLRGYPDAVALVAVPSLGIPAGTPADILIAGLASQASVSSKGEDDYSTFLPTAGLTYHWTPRISTGLTYTEGYRSGGVSFNQATAQIVSFDPEYTRTAELSFRSQWLEDRLTLNANVFYTRWRDQQIMRQFDQSDVYNRAVVNAAKSEYYGLEIELRQWLSNGWSLYQNIGYTHTNFLEFDTEEDSLADKEFPQAPRWTLGVGTSYTHASGWFGNTSFTYIDNAWASEDNIPGFVLGERHLLEAKVGFQGANWQVYVFGSNLLDDDYLNRLWRDANNPGTGYGAVVGRPRVVGIGFEASY